MIAKHKPLAWFGEAGVIQKAIEPMLLRRMRERGLVLPHGVTAEHR